MILPNSVFSPSVKSGASIIAAPPYFLKSRAATASFSSGERAQVA
jgi:hypothetical protein